MPAKNHRKIEVSIPTVFYASLKSSECCYLNRFPVYPEISRQLKITTQRLPENTRNFFKVMCAPGYNEVTTSKVDLLHGKSQDRIVKTLLLLQVKYS